MTEFYQAFNAPHSIPQPNEFSAEVRRALARSMISYTDAVKLYWMMEFVAEAPVGTDFVYVGPMDDLLERLGPMAEEEESDASRVRKMAAEFEAAELEAMIDRAARPRS